MGTFVQIVTVILLGIFLYFAGQAHWFDFIWKGNRPTEIDFLAEMRANVALAGLLGWALRNEFDTYWRGHGGH